MSAFNVVVVPVGNTEAGLGLTPKNWEEINIETLAFSLPILLSRPGLSLLNKLKNLKNYLGWPGKIVLNGYSLKKHAHRDSYLFRLHDGRLGEINSQELLSLLCQLSPDSIVLPVDFAFPADCSFDVITQLYNPNRKIENGYLQDCFLLCNNPSPSSDRYTQAKNGSYLIADSGLHCDLNIDSLLTTLEKHLSLAYTSNSNNNKTYFVETNLPAQDALLGKVYLKKENGSLTSILLSENQYRTAYEVVDSLCICPTCQSGYTKSYLHHLFQHTPLLCYRFLIQHNVYALQNSLITQPFNFP